MTKQQPLAIYTRSAQCSPCIGWIWLRLSRVLYAFVDRMQKQELCIMHTVFVQSNQPTNQTVRCLSRTTLFCLAFLIGGIQRTNYSGRTRFCEWIVFWSRLQSAFHGLVTEKLEICKIFGVDMNANESSTCLVARNKNNSRFIYRPQTEIILFHHRILPVYRGVRRTSL